MVYHWPGAGSGDRRGWYVRLHRRALAAAVLACLGGCSGINALLERGADAGTTPIVRGADGGQARLTIIVCVKSQAGAQAAIDLIQYLLQQPELVIARSGGAAVLTINACPGGER